MTAFPLASNVLVVVGGTARVVTCGLGLVGTLGACFGGYFGNVLEATMTISNFFGGSLVGVFLLGMLVRRATATGALAGIAGGLAVVFLVSALTKVAGMWFGAVSSLSAFGIGWLASLFCAPPPRESQAMVVGGAGERPEEVRSSVGMTTQARPPSA